MAKEKTVTVPRGTVLAYRVLQLEIEGDRWGKWRLEEQGRPDCPSRRAEGGGGATSKCGPGREKEKLFSPWPEQSASQARIPAAPKRT